MLWFKRKRYKDPRKNPRWKEWRSSVFHRDRFTCRICRQRGGELHPHHIISKMLFPEYAFKISNGITLCAKCHIEKNVHSTKRNMYVRRFAKLTGLKLPRARQYHLEHKEK